MLPNLFRRIAIVVLVVLSLSLSAYNAFGLATQPAGRDYVSMWESRLQPIKRKLPAGTTYVGYVADEDLRPVWSPTNGELVEFDLTRYTLIPVVVQHGIKLPWIIGNFSAKNFDHWLTHVLGAHTLDDLGSGIYLIHRAEK